MSAPEPEPTAQPEPTVVQQAEEHALNLGRSVLGRELTPDELEALSLIFRSTVQALRRGFIRRLAQHVAAERTDEALEEFFEGRIHTD